MPDLPRLLLTNDDGIDAPGIAALEAAVAGQGRVVVVAPAGAMSGCGHMVTTHASFGNRSHAPERFSVDGSPADCVRLALHHLTGPVDWIVSGINAGGNLGVDVVHSGTVAAVREGVIHGIPGIAISHYIAKGRTIDWTRATRWATKVIAMLLERETPPETFWNVNLPHPEPDAPDPEVVFCRVDPSPLPLNYQTEPGLATYSGSYQTRARREGWDVDVCFQGAIAVSLVDLLGSNQTPR